MPGLSSIHIFTFLCGRGATLSLQACGRFSQATQSISIAATGDTAIFQNRFKSIVCEEDPYLLELTRYIHLNPLRAGIVKDMNELDVYPWTGHAVIMGKECRPWQDRDAILALFGKVEGQARKRYRQFVEDGLAMGKRADLTGGGLLRSQGGWAEVVSIETKA
jgi:hypothetical protein